MAVSLHLIGPPPWGFRVRGGRDFRGPLTITKVHEDSKAAVWDLRPGDVIVEVNGEVTATMLNMEAQGKIRNSTSHLKLLIDRPSIPYLSCSGHRFKPGYLLRQDLEAQSDEKGSRRLLTAKPIRTSLPVTSISPTSEEPRLLIAQPMRSPVPGNVPGAPAILKKRSRTTTNHQACRFRGQSGKPSESLHDQRRSKPGHQAITPTDTRTPSAASKTTSAKISAPLVTPRNSSEMSVWKYPALETDVYKRIQQKRVTFAIPKQSRTFYLLQEGLEAPSMRNPSLSRPPLQSSIATGSRRFRSCERCGSLIVTQVVRLAEGRLRHVECYSCEECGLSLLGHGHFWVGEELLCRRHAWHRHQGAAGTRCAGGGGGDGGAKSARKQ